MTSQGQMQVAVRAGVATAVKKVNNGSYLLLSVQCWRYGPNRQEMSINQPKWPKSGLKQPFLVPEMTPKTDPFLDLVLRSF